MTRVALSLLCLSSLVGVGHSKSPDPRPPSLSLGTPARGYLSNARQLAHQGPHHRVIPKTQRRGFHYGTAEMISFIEEIARRVARRAPGAQLQVANIAREHGGNIPQSVTHNSGRDVDLVFYALSADGKPAYAGFVHFDHGGRSGELRFDVRRNWELVKAALEMEPIRVQSMLLHGSLERLLIAHARRTHEPEELIDRARKLLRQARSPHDDHFHVRIYCARHERLEGCINTGPVYSWARTYDAEVAARIAKLRREFKHSDAGRAAYALTKVGMLRGRDALGEIIESLDEKRIGVRIAALEGVIHLKGVNRVAKKLIRTAMAAGPGRWQSRVVELFAKRPPRRAQALFVAALEGGDRQTVQTRVTAVNGLAKGLFRDSVRTLVSHLNDPAPEVAAAAWDALRRITNQDFAADAHDRWMRWWRAHRHRSRIRWVMSGFERRHKLKFTAERCPDTMDKLIALTREPGLESFHARAVITEVTGYKPFARDGSRWLERKYRKWYRRGGAKKCSAYFEVTKAAMRAGARRPARNARAKR